MLQQVEPRTSSWPPAMPPPAPERTSADWTSLPEIHLQATWSSAGSSRQGHDYMHARFYSPQMARFFSVDPVNGDPKNPQSWNRYAYVQNNPLRYTDPDGRSISEEAFKENARRRQEIEEKLKSIRFIGGLLARAADFLLADVMPKNLAEFEGAMSSAVLGLARVPGAGGVAGKVGGATPVRAGQAGEAAVRKAVDIGPKEPLRIGGRTRIPDGVTREAISEVKNRAYVPNMQQLRDFQEIAGNTGRRFDLYVRPETRLSRPLEETIERGVINRRFIPE